MFLFKNNFLSVQKNLRDDKLTNSLLKGNFIKFLYKIKENWNMIMLSFIMVKIGVYIKIKI